MSNELQNTLTKSEEQIALDYLSGVKDIDSFRQAYPNNKCDDRRAKYMVKKIIQRPHVQAYIEHLQKRGDVTDQITESSVKSYIWRTALDNPNTNLGLKAALALGKEFGVGAEHIHIVEEKQYDRMLDEIHEYYDAIERGETPNLPACILNDGEEPEEVEFKILEEEDDD